MRKRNAAENAVTPLRACFFCYARFPANSVAEHTSRGERVAYDPLRGRLWIVCTGCGRWNLTPIESRWESIEELDRLCTDRGRVLTSTDNIALLELRRLQVVRVGRTNLREEAWWRYSQRMKQRHLEAQRTRQWGKFQDTMIMMAITGLPLPVWRDAQVHVDRARRRQYGRYAWTGRLHCMRCGNQERGIHFDDIGSLRIAASGGLTRLWLHCHRCGRVDDAAGYTIEGSPAGQLLRRVLAYRNYSGAPDWQVERATELVVRAGSGTALSEDLTARGTYLSLLDADQTLALEIAVNESHEAALLRLQAAELEQRWREEERIAAIVDRELS